MSNKLGVTVKKTVKYWDSVKKYCVSYWCSEYSQLSAGWGKTAKQAEEECFNRMRRFVESEREFRKNAEEVSTVRV